MQPDARIRASSSGSWAAGMAIWLTQRTPSGASSRRNSLVFRGGVAELSSTKKNSLRVAVSAAS